MIARCNKDLTTKFTGKERDSESGLDNFGARYNSSSMGRWMSPDAINLTDARVQNPANTFNKYIYSGNNPLKYIDPDGKDITLFYYPPTFGNEGHFSLVAADPQTGRGAELNFGPQKTGNPWEDTAAKFNEALFGNEPGDVNYGRNIGSADELRNAAAALTIQTNPEETQRAIDAINRFNNGQPPDWNLLGPNCTTVCRDLVNKILGTKDCTTVKPSTLWEKLSTDMQKALRGCIRTGSARLNKQAETTASQGTEWTRSTFFISV